MRPITCAQDSKQAVAEDYLPDGTHVPAGAVLVYRMYTMGRLERSVDSARQHGEDS